MQVTNNIHYVGVNDRQKALFEGLWPLPCGVSYNAYLISDEKTCLVDTVEIDFFPQLLENIREAIGERPIDYLVVNHMEPDHSGAIALIRKYYPDLQVVGNKKTLEMLQGFYGQRNERDIEVRNGDTIDLGQTQLTFVLTPMVHWPETMMTLAQPAPNAAGTEGAPYVCLFSGDAFGCFGALNGGILDTQINTDPFWPEMERYYSNIVGKYGVPVQQALKKLQGTEITHICPTHGPVWHEHLQRVVGIYDRLSRYEAEPGLVICYGTMYGNTERMAEQIARAASQAGVKNIVVYNVSKTHHSYILRDIFRYRGLIVGAPTYNASLYHEMDVLLSEIANREIRTPRLFGWFGSHTWASKAVSEISRWNEERLHFIPVGEPVDMKQSLTEDVRRQCEALGRAMAESLLA